MRSALRELALTFYDTRAIVVEVVARLVGMRDPVGTPLYARQLAALEALQIYAPLGHGLGLRPLCAQLEDRCFQVRLCNGTIAYGQLQTLSLKFSMNCLIDRWLRLTAVH